MSSQSLEILQEAASKLDEARQVLLSNEGMNFETLAGSENALDIMRQIDGANSDLKQIIRDHGYKPEQ